MKRRSLYCLGPDDCIGVRINGRTRYIPCFDAIELVNMPRWLKKYRWLLNNRSAMRRLTALVNGPINILDGVSRPPPTC